MPDNKHTPEPWHIGFHTQEGRNICAPETGAVIATIKHRSDEDARRIVACVNACAGSSTEWLEFSVSEDCADLSGPFEPLETRITSILKTGLAYMVERNQMKMQRDELLAALERVAEDWVNPGDSMPFEDGEMPALDIARAAIASVKGEQ